MRGRHTHDMGLRSTLQSTHRQMPPQQGHSQSDRVYQVGDTWEKKKKYLLDTAEGGRRHIPSEHRAWETQHCHGGFSAPGLGRKQKNEEKTGKYDGNQRGVGNAVEELGGYF